MLWKEQESYLTHQNTQIKFHWQPNKDKEKSNANAMCEKNHECTGFDQFGLT